MFDTKTPPGKEELEKRTLMGRLSEEALVTYIKVEL